MGYNIKTALLEGPRRR